jgi:hypothetical protein
MAVDFDEVKGETLTFDSLWVDAYEPSLVTPDVSLGILDEEQSGSYAELIGRVSDSLVFLIVSSENLLPDSLIEKHTSSGRSAARVGEDDGFSYIFHRLNLLMEPPDGEMDESGGALLPTKYSVELARNLLNQSSRMLQGTFTRASVSTSFEGGIRIEWISPDSSVRVVVPADESSRGYIYYESGELFGIHDLTVGNLIRLLLETY